MNSIATEILATTDKHFFPNRPMAGFSGDIVRDLALETVKQLVAIRTEEQLDFEIVGVGGIMKSEHFDLFFDAGATVALSTTGLINNHSLVQEYVQSTLV